MNLGDGLLFELENGKPKLILLSHGVEKNHTKPLFRPRAANILSSRQPSCLEELQGEEAPTWQQTARRKDARIKTVVAAATRERGSILTSSKTTENHNGSGIKAVARVKSDRQKQSSALGSSRTNKRSGKSQNTVAHSGGNVGPKETLSNGDAGHKDSMVVLTAEQLQKIISSVQTSSKTQQSAEKERLQGLQSSGTHLNGAEMEEEERGGEEEMKKGDDGGNGTSGVSQGTDNRLSGCLFSWMEERQSDCRSTIENKKAQWRRELDEQVALKQQQKRSAPDRSQFDEDPRSVLSSHSSLNHREQPAAIRSSLKLGDITPIEEMLSTERREEQRRRWLEELGRQREETAERRRREKVLRSQTEEPDLWTTHFDSLQRRPPVHSSAPPPALSCTSERGEWEPSSSLSLVWEATSSCGAESVAGVSVDMTSKYPSRASYLRTMTALLDPAQIEERERRRQKQLEQQRVIEAQVEERRRQREQEQARRRQEEEEEARRIALEREMLHRQYELDTTRESQKEQQSQMADHQPGNDQIDDKVQETLESTVTRQREDVRSSDPPYKDTAVQTEAAPFSGISEERVHAPEASAQYQHHTAPTNSKNAALRMGKENVCQPGGAGGGGGGDPYEQFARTERSKRDKKRPEWNTQKPSRRFVPASERYPVTLQRNRLDSRLKRQAELMALQERTCMSRTEPPAAAPQHNNPRLCSSSTQARKGPNSKTEDRQNSSSNSSSERHRLQSQQAADPLPPLVQEFVPFIRTDEVTLDPLEADAGPSAQTHTNTDAPFPPPSRPSSPPASSRPDSERQLGKTHTQRQQEILRGLAQLRQGLLQKQRELETDLNPLLKCHEKKL